MTIKPLVVINIVGLTKSLLGKHTPNINRLIEDGFIADMQGVFPAVTCTAQASMLTGDLPSKHGIVANGWYYRDISEVFFWRQSNRLIAGEKVWHAAKKQFPEFTTAQMFWWYNMYADVDWSVTPRPIYPADGRKIPGLYSSPPDLHEKLQEKLGDFPLFNFWGPKANILSSDWIAKSSAEVFRSNRPGLSLVYLPHLDYNLQRLGPNDPQIWQDVEQVDKVTGELIDSVRSEGADVMIVSEYGIEQATGHVNINQVLREAGLLATQQTLDWELLDYGACRAFAVADHQIAHVYVKNSADLSNVKCLLEKTPGIEYVLCGEDKSKWHIDHERSGEIVVVAEKGYWFTYYYWQDENKAPDFARTVDIHRKPGYDPVELFIDPDIKFPHLKVAARLLQKKMGMRYLMDVIPLKPELVKGTHGRLAYSPEEGPLMISSRQDLACENIKMTDIKSFILGHY